MTINRSGMFFVLIALAPVSFLRAQLVGVEFNTGSFYSISTTDGSLQFIGDTDIENIGALEFNPQDGFLYGFTTGAAKLTNLYRFTISPTLDAVTAELVGPLGLSTFEGAIAFSPTGDMFAVNGGSTVPALLALDAATGDATLINSFADRHDINGLGWRSDGFLVGLDNTDDALLAIDPITAGVTVIDQVGTAIGSVGGMAMGEAGNFFVTAGPLAVDPGSNSLYSFDPFTGDHVFIASYENQILANGFSGLAFIPEPATLALLSLGGLALLRRRSTS
jgi:hypothetical protein